MKKIIKFIFSKIKLFYLDQSEKLFIKHNKTFFKNFENKDFEVLIENNDMQPNHIALSYFAFSLSKIYNAELTGYQPKIKFGLINKLKFYLIDFKIKKIYKSFGINKTLNHNIDGYESFAHHLTEKLMFEINSKKDLINLTIDDISFGDLIYDQYLAEYQAPTIELKSKKLRKILFDFSVLYYYWKNCFSKKNIKALVVGHACYFMGMPARIAVYFDIPVYLVNLHNVYFLSKDNLFPNNEFHKYKEDFEKLDIDTKKNAQLDAKERIKLIFEGKTDVDQPYIKNSAYSGVKTLERIIKNEKKIKVLIASHSFYDSPNGLGKNLFPDYYEWLEFVGNLSNQTDYEWYIKTHPGIGPRDTKTVNDFVSRYNKITLIPNRTSHHQLIEEGINIVLTVHGSIGLEYAAKNITVINASINNPHISFDFNIHPKSKEELKDIILNLDSYEKLNLFSHDVYKCYYMKYRYHSYNIFFKDFKSIEKHLGGHKSLFSSKIYDYWINYFNPDIHNQIKINLEKFLLSKEYKLKSNWN